MGEEVLTQKPFPGSHRIYREGDFLHVELYTPESWKGSAWIRTSLYKPDLKYQELIEKTEQSLPRRYQDWGDLPMDQEAPGHYHLAVPLVTVGFFEAKAFFLPEGQQEPVWPAGDNLFVKVEPAESLISNSIYSAFVRLFIGEQAISRIRDNLDSMESMTDRGFSTIPESGKFRDLAQQVDFIVDELGFDIIMLLPVHPVPTSYARMGLLGSPYAALDFMNVDPAMAEFDKETTPMEQFGELIDAVHAKHARIFMDIPVNHTGWASQLQVHHPEYFVKTESGKFVSPGAWGVTWSDLAELDYQHRGLWEYMAGIFLFWCDKGIDGFRCDAGYMIPPQAWKYITARVRREYPSTIFLLEGLGGKVSTTEQLLTRCNLNWAYSEMFQNYDQGQMEWYIQEYSNISFSRGPLVNFSETHDNNRLASISKDFSRLRNALLALLSDTGTFGITCGVEWFATEKIDVHRLTSLNWGDPDNQVALLRRLNNIIKTHPSFQSGSSLQKIHTSQTNSIAYKRHSPDGNHSLIILANLSDGDNHVTVDRQAAEELSQFRQDLLSGEDILLTDHNGDYKVELKPYQVAAISNDPQYHYQAVDMRVDRFIKEAKAERQLKLQVMKLFLPFRDALDEQWIEERTKDFEKNPIQFFYDHFPGRPPVIQWSHPRDTRREVVVPDGTPVLVSAGHYFRFRLRDGGEIIEHGEGFYLKDGLYVSILPPDAFEKGEDHFQLEIEVYDGKQVSRHTGRLMVASSRMLFSKNAYTHDEVAGDPNLVALAVNQRAGTTIARGAFSELRSKYDALISANLHPDYPEDRHIMLTRIRGWTVYKGFSRFVNLEYQVQFAHRGNSIQYYFHMPAGGGMHIPLLVQMVLDPHEDHLVIFIKRLRSAELNTPPADDPIRLILRPDIESRNHHELTKAYEGPEDQWPGAIREQEAGFDFVEGPGRLDMQLSKGRFVREDEWQYMVHRPVEAERGMDSDSDLYSPGYFAVNLLEEEQVALQAGVRNNDQDKSVTRPPGGVHQHQEVSSGPSQLQEDWKESIRKFIVRRNTNNTVIAGYPWFLDWGRDTLICLRGIIAAGYLEEAERIIMAFAAFEEKGTLPNVIRGSDTSNRDTSDAPLWFFAAVRELMQQKDSGLLEKKVDSRSLREVLNSIAHHYRKGTPNGIRMDTESGLIYSPTHFTWMDTNHPPGTPRQGYPIEIQALWYHALSFMVEHGPDDQDWASLARQVKQSISGYFTVYRQDEAGGYQPYLCDCLHAQKFVPASRARRDDHIRPNQLFAITMGAIDNSELAAGILAACEQLLIPGAIRSLADEDTQYPLAVYHQGRLLNNPNHPYQGYYTGDEDHSRKPAYHNGTAWTWPFPSYSEALWLTFGSPAKQSARDILSTSMKLYHHGGVDQLPEVLDGNAPHLQKGCFAQAWGMTEFYRVARLLDMTGE